MQLIDSSENSEVKAFVQRYLRNSKTDTRTDSTGGDQENDSNRVIHFVWHIHKKVGLNNHFD